MSCFTGWLEAVSRRSSELNLERYAFGRLSDSIKSTIRLAEKWTGKNYNSEQIADKLGELYILLTSTEYAIEKDINTAFDKNWNRRKDNG